VNEASQEIREIRHDAKEGVALLGRSDMLIDVKNETHVYVEPPKHMLSEMDRVKRLDYVVIIVVTSATDAKIRS
jgi:hypothetical protein